MIYSRYISKSFYTFESKLNKKKIEIKENNHKHLLHFLNLNVHNSSISSYCDN